MPRKTLDELCYTSACNHMPTMMQNVSIIQNILLSPLWLNPIIVYFLLSAFTDYEKLVQ